MPYGKTPMKKKGSMMHMEGKNSTHANTDKNYPNDGHLHYKDGKKIPTPAKMNYDSPMKAGHSPMKMQGSFMSKHSSSALHMGHSPMKMENVIDRDAKSSGKNQYDKYGK
jgi:hypothetical protein